MEIKRKVSPPKFAKVDDFTIKITIEQADEVNLNVLVDNKTKMLVQKKAMTKQYEEQVKAIDGAIKNIDTILNEAETLGIKVQEIKQGHSHTGVV